MAVHNSIPSLLRESITEYIVIAEFCIKSRKNISVWGAPGCFGYPATVLLLAITDAIGSYVLGGNTKNHFNILKHNHYYNLNLSDYDLDKIYKEYRCFLTHNATLSLNVF